MLTIQICVKQVTKSAIQRFGLEAWANKPVKTYSGGTKRKLSTALALLGEPQLILLVGIGDSISGRTFFMALLYIQPVHDLKEERFLVWFSE